MARPVDIAALADEILNTVSTVSEKTASADVDATQTEIAKAIKLAAKNVRGYNDPEVDDADIVALMAGLQKHANGTTAATMGAMSGSPAGAAMGSGIANPVNSSAPGPAPSNPTGQIAPKIASPMGDELRKLAHAVRVRGQEHEEQRLVKAAQMVTAAAGIKHLTAALQKS